MVRLPCPGQVLTHMSKSAEDSLPGSCRDSSASTVASIPWGTKGNKSTRYSGDPYLVPVPGIIPVFSTGTL